MGLRLTLHWQTSDLFLSEDGFTLSRRLRLVSSFRLKPSRDLTVPMTLTLEASELSQSLETHSCQYCKAVVLRTKWSNAHYDNYCTLDSLDIDYIQKANEAGCALFMRLLNKLAENGHSVSDLMPYPSLYQRWDPSHTRDGRHLSLHLTKGHIRLCTGVPFKIFSSKSWKAKHHGTRHLWRGSLA